MCCWQRCTLLWHVVAMANNFLRLPLIFQGLIHVTLLVSRILRGFLKFLENLCTTVLIHVVIQNQSARSEQVSQILSHKLHSTNSVQIKMVFCFHEVAYFGTTVTFNPVTVLPASDSAEIFLLLNPYSLHQSLYLQQLPSFQTL